MKNANDILKDALLAFKPPEKLTLSEFADKHCYLSLESSSEGGRWKTLPYQKAIMDAVTDPNIEQISVMKSARVGYTKILNHVIAYYVANDACPIMLVQPSLEDCQGYSKEELAPMIRDTPCLQGLISEAKAKDGSNTLMSKQFPGGSIGLVGSNSARGFRRVSRRVVLFDEVDGYAPSAGSEGDQIKLGIKRTDFYWNRKIIAGSTPTDKDFSRIEKLFEKSDQRRYFVPCPDCGEMQYLKFDNFRWTDDDPSTTKYACEKCGVLIPHEKKRWMIERGEWRKTAEGNGKHAGFHIWAAYSYSPNASWPQLIEEWLSCQGDIEQIKTFRNTIEGELWTDEFERKVGASQLMERASKETYKRGVPPREVLLLVAGIDTQDDRLSLSVWGAGAPVESATYDRPEQLYLIDRIVLYGNPGRKDVWDQLDEVLTTPYINEDGIELKIIGAAIDSGGHFTEEVYRWAKDRVSMGVMPIKGVDRLRGDVMLGKPNKVEYGAKGKVLRNSIRLYSIGVNKVKSYLYRRLRDAEPGDGYLHFYPTITEQYFEELTAEKEVRKYKAGRIYERVWQLKSGARNEAWDELIYAYSCVLKLYQTHNRRSMWDKFANRLLKSNKSDKNNLKDAKVNTSAKRNYVNSW